MDQKHDFELIQGPEVVEVQLAAFFIKADENIIIKIVHSGGIGIAPLTIFPKEGAASEGARIVSQKMTDSGWQGRFDGLAEKKYEARVWSEEEVQSISGGIILEKDGPLYTIEFRGSAVVEVLL
jgi:hypothetical protein